MAIPVAYDYYTGTYGGTAIKEEGWQHLYLLAAAHVDRLRSLCRVTARGDDAEACESNAICAIAEVMLRWEGATIASGDLASERVGSVAITYRTPEQIFPDGLEVALHNAAMPWLHVCRVVG